MGLVARIEYQPCAKADGELRRQRWLGTMKWKSHTYHRWSCNCVRTGRHINRLLAFSAGNTKKYLASGSSVSVMSGRSIFGQTLRRGG